MIYLTYDAIHRALQYLTYPGPKVLKPTTSTMTCQIVSYPVPASSMFAWSNIWNDSYIQEYQDPTIGVDQGCMLLLSIFTMEKD